MSPDYHSLCFFTFLLSMLFWKVRRFYVMGCDEGGGGGGGVDSFFWESTLTPLCSECSPANKSSSVMVLFKTNSRKCLLAVYKKRFYRKTVDRPEQLTVQNSWSSRTVDRPEQLIVQKSWSPTTVDSKLCGKEKNKICPLALRVCESF